MRLASGRDVFSNSLMFLCIFYLMELQLLLLKLVSIFEWNYVYHTVSFWASSNNDEKQSDLPIFFQIVCCVAQIKCMFKQQNYQVVWTWTNIGNFIHLVLRVAVARNTSIWCKFTFAVIIIMQMQNKESCTVKYLSWSKDCKDKKYPYCCFSIHRVWLKCLQIPMN